MARRTADKLERGMIFIIALRNPRIAGALATRGFTQKDRDEGWALINEATKMRLDLPGRAPNDPSIIQELDEWENTWFGVAKAALENNFADAYAHLFLNLSQTDGPAVVTSVGTFIERLGKMGEGDHAFGKQAKEARARLESRGLTSQVLEQAKGLLSQLKTEAASADPPDLEKLRDESEAAEEKFWHWYLEWSQLAHTCISDRRLLREMGFLAPQHHVNDQLPDGPTAPGQPPTPTTPTTPA
jgi:hypothetical protein